MKLNKLSQLTALSMTLFCASTYAASNDALLDLLVKKGVLTQGEATNVAKELETDQPVFGQVDEPSPSSQSKQFRAQPA